MRPRKRPPRAPRRAAGGRPVTPRAAPAKTPARRAPAKKAAKAGAKKGSAPAKKAAPQASAGRSRAKESDGAQLKREISQDRDTVGVKVLIRQAARVSDRLQSIGEVLDGSATAWRRVGIPRLDTDGGRIEVHVNVTDLVKEERAQSALLRNLLGEIHRQRAGLPGGGVPPDEDDDLDV